MNEDIWASIEDRYRRRPKAMASPVSADEFDRVMAGFLLKVDPDYREFVLRYGGGFVDSEPIYGLRKAEFMGNIAGKGTAPEITQFFRDKRWPGAEDWFIFTVDGGGNPVGFAKDGSVWLSDQLDFGQILKLASGFEDYLLKWCFRTRKVVDYNGGGQK